MKVSVSVYDDEEPNELLVDCVEASGITFWGPLQLMNIEFIEEEVLLTIHPDHKPSVIGMKGGDEEEPGAIEISTGKVLGEVIWQED